MWGTCEGKRDHHHVPVCTATDVPIPIIIGTSVAVPAAVLADPIATASLPTLDVGGGRAARICSFSAAVGPSAVFWGRAAVFVPAGARSVAADPAAVGFRSVVDPAAGRRLVVVDPAGNRSFAPVVVPVAGFVRSLATGCLAWDQNMSI